MKKKEGNSQVLCNLMHNEAKTVLQVNNQSMDKIKKGGLQKFRQLTKPYISFIIIIGYIYAVDI